jgi:hypothetical protein
MILSVSRRTDIPAFYSDWFYNRIKEGFVLVRHPINKKLIHRIKITPEVVDCIVFWTKNPANLMLNLGKLKDYPYYFQFTVNPYNSAIETNVPMKKFIFQTFRKLSETIGKEKVIWRYDPIFFTSKINADYHIKYFNEIARHLSPYTEKCIISFLDLYKKTERNLSIIQTHELSKPDIISLVKVLKQIASSYNIQLETCAEEIDLLDFGIEHGHCIDPQLIERIIGAKITVQKDKYQREICGCVESFDLGAYNTCKHNCLYCYATFNSKMVFNNTLCHIPTSPLLIGSIKSGDIIKDKNGRSFRFEIFL